MFSTATRFAFPKSTPSSFLSLNLRCYFHSRSSNPNNIHDAVASFNRLLHLRPLPSVVQFNKILGAIVKMKHYPTAISLSSRAESKGITPSLVFMNILINCYSHGAYVMSFDGETLERYVIVRSKEAVIIIENLTEALFGRPEIAPDGQLILQKTRT
ncbi:pentatricopeptide repeat-containing protein [Senna tora]|uniref:Pentatricopeptide repeat-containing protein n=1 Tax=Senna tora TaxID=362788 RepID=A0A834T0D6_9FABA|nr:pentatricopeptide repeat-containing protein [Senna tora]